MGYLGGNVRIVRISVIQALLVWGFEVSESDH